MNAFNIRHIPAATFPAHYGANAPLVSVDEHFDLTLVCSRGLRWNGGEFATRAEAEARGLQATQRPSSRLRGR
jgi:hypothetical protein